MDHLSRLRGLRRRMAQQEIPALLIMHLPDVRWLCGFTGSNAALVVSARKPVLFTDGRYTAQAKEETQAARVVIVKKSVLNEAAALLEASAEQAFFDPEQTTVAQLAIMRSAVSPKVRKSFFKPLAVPVVSALRMVKDSDEIRLMEQAAALGCTLFDAILPHLQPGVPETEVAANLEFFARNLGAEGMSFETIVASGQRSALPHGRATEAKLPRNGFVTLDFGVILKGYCSDMTRTVCLGKPDNTARGIYDAVLGAQQAAVDAVRPGVTCGEVDEAARGILRKAKLAQYFTHSTGHGVGLEIHESPRIAAGQNTVLEPGMIVTIEPGVYLAGKFGIRIEDMVAVTAQGRRVLTPAIRALIEL